MQLYWRQKSAILLNLRYFRGIFQGYYLDFNQFITDFQDLKYTSRLLLLTSTRSHFPTYKMKPKRLINDLGYLSVHDQSYICNKYKKLMQLA